MIYPQILVWQFEYEAGAPQTPVFKDKWQKPVFPARELWVKTLQIIHLNCDRQNFWKNQQSCDIPIFFGFQQDSHVFLRIKLAFNKTSFALGSQHCCAARRYRSSSLEVLAVKASQSHSLRDGQHCHWARSSGSWAQFKDKKMYWAAHACAAGDDRGVCQRAPAWQRVQKTHGKSWQPRAGTIKPAWGPHYGSSSDPKQRLCLPVRLPGCEELWDFKSKSGRKVGDASSVWTFWVFLSVAHYGSLRVHQNCVWSAWAIARCGTGEAGWTRLWGHIHEEEQRGHHCFAPNSQRHRSSCARFHKGVLPKMAETFRLRVQPHWYPTAWKI